MTAARRRRANRRRNRPESLVGGRKLGRREAVEPEMAWLPDKAGRFANSAVGTAADAGKGTALFIQDVADHRAAGDQQAADADAARIARVEAALADPTLDEVERLGLQQRLEGLRQRQAVAAETADRKRQGEFLGARAGGDPTRHPFYEFSESGQEALAMPTDSTRDDDPSSKFFEAAGAAVPVLAGGGASLLARVPAVVGSALVAGAANSGNAHDEALDFGASPEDARRAAVKARIIGTATEALPVSRVLPVGRQMRSVRGEPGGLLDRASDRALDGLVDGTVKSAIEGAARNAIAGPQGVGYDRDRGLTDGLADRMGAGGLVGATIAAAGQGRGHPKASHPSIARRAWVEGALTAAADPRTGAVDPVRALRTLQDSRRWRSLDPTERSRLATGLRLIERSPGAAELSRLEPADLATLLTDRRGQRSLAGIARGEV